jgi:hypothetical protein
MDSFGIGFASKYGARHKGEQKWILGMEDEEFWSTGGYIYIYMVIVMLHCLYRYYIFIAACIK